jgi:hypothetical protein
MSARLLARLTGLLAVLLPGAAEAQGDCFPSKDSNEARTFAIISTALAFGPAGAPVSDGARVRLGVELVYLPNIDRATATPTACRPGKGPENTDLVAAAPRPRVAVALGSGFSAEGSWIPPVRLNQVEANLIGFALAWTTALGAQNRLTLRGHGTVGRIRAPITCPDQALGDPASECFEGQRSDDSFRPNILGVEAIVGWSLGSGRVQPYLGTGYNHLAPRFQVDFTNAVGGVDRRRVEVDLDRAVLFGGATWLASPGVGLSAELYASPADAITGRLAIRVGL